MHTHAGRTVGKILDGMGPNDTGFWTFELYSEGSAESLKAMKRTEQED